MYLEKEDVKLYYEVRGEGEPLLLIHGIGVDAWFYQNAGEILQKYYKVITFDRRGNSRSQCPEGTDFSVEANSRDAKDLLDYLGIDQAIVVGASAGGVTGIDFMRHYPERVKKLIVYEAALLGLMSDVEEVTTFIDKMHDLIARRKVSTALLQFAYSIASFDDRGPKKPEEIAMRELGNVEHSLFNEFDVFIHYVPDVEWFKDYADRITVAVGEKSNQTIYVQAATRFAETIGCRLLHYPGYHNLPCDLPEEFAACILGTLML